MKLRDIVSIVFAFSIRNISRAYKILCEFRYRRRMGFMQFSDKPNQLNLNKSMYSHRLIEIHPMV
jgi:uncharacterized Zn-finger protein